MKKCLFIGTLCMSLVAFMASGIAHAPLKQKLKQTDLYDSCSSKSESSSSSTSKKKSCDSECHLSKHKPRHLNILLTNDDGLDEDILTLWTELTNRGHNVFGFVPDQNVSGTGSGIIAASYTFAEFDSANFPNFFEVAASPFAYTTFPTAAECVTVGMSWMGMRDLPLDMVISGVNFDLSTGPIYSISGTNGAALFATASLVPPPYLDVPAIAINIPADRSPERVDLACVFTANLVNYLDQHRDEDDRLLPRGVMLSLKIPSVDSDLFLASCGNDTQEPPIKGVVLTKSGRYFNTDLSFERERTFLVAWPDFDLQATVSNDGTLGPFEAATNFFNEKIFADGFTAEVVLADPFDANTPLVNDVRGKIVLAERSGCFSSVKADNIARAGGIGMILDGLEDFPFSLGAIAPQQYAIPSVTLATGDAAALEAALTGGGTVTVTLNYHVEDDGSIIYNNGFAGNMFYVPKDELDKNPTSDTNAVRKGYIAITPVSNEATFGVSKSFKKLCCLLRPVLTEGPSLCKSSHKVSNLLPPQGQAARKPNATKFAKVLKDRPKKQNKSLVL